MHAVVIQSSSEASGGMLATVAGIPYINSVTALPRELFAIARVRLLQPDVIFLSADGWAEDETGLLAWLRTHRECKHVIMLRDGMQAHTGSTPRLPGVPVLELPGEESRLAELLGMAASF